LCNDFEETHSLNKYSIYGQKKLQSRCDANFGAIQA